MDTKLASGLLDSVDARSGELRALLQELVRCPSVVGAEGEAGRLIGATLEQWGIGNRLLASEPDRPNVVAVRPGSGGGANLLFCGGHIDHVPVGDASAWTFDPYGGDEVDGWVRGRGASNGKGQVAASMFALRLLVESGYEHAGDLVYCAVVDEEAMGRHGARFLVENGHVYGDWGVLGVPGRRDQVLIGTKGPLWLTIRVHGVTGHGAAPWLGVNAIEKASKLVLALQSMKFDKEHPAWGGERIGTRGGPTGTLGVNLIAGGWRPNMIPASCDVSVDRRLLPNETPEEGLRQIEDVLARLAAEDDKFSAEIVDVAHSESGYVISTDEPVVGMLEQATADAIGVPELKGACAAGTGDSRWFVEAGIPTAGYGTSMFGPDGKVAFYRPDEQVRFDEVVECAKVYLMAMLRGTERRDDA